MKSFWDRHCENKSFWQVLLFGKFLLLLLRNKVMKNWRSMIGINVLPTPHPKCHCSSFCTSFLPFFLKKPSLILAFLVSWLWLSLHQPTPNTIHVWSPLTKSCTNVQVEREKSASFARFRLFKHCSTLPPFLLALNWFPRAAETNEHKFGGLIQQKCILSSSERQKS